MKPFQKIFLFSTLALIFGVAIFGVGCNFFRTRKNSDSTFKNYNAPDFQLDTSQTNNNVNQNFSEDTMENPPLINTSDWSTYKNEKYGFRFQYPKDWLLTEEQNIIHVRSNEMISKLYENSFKLIITSNSFEYLKKSIEESDQLSNGTSLSRFYDNQRQTEINGHKTFIGSHATAVGLDEKYYYIILNGKYALYFEFIEPNNSVNTKVEDVIRTFNFEND